MRKESEMFVLTNTYNDTLRPQAPLVRDLVKAVNQQFEADGTFKTLPGNAEWATKQLSEKYAGSLIIAKVSDASDVLIFRRGLYEHDGDGNYEYVRFHEAVGVVQEISPSNGGYISLEGGMTIALPLRPDDHPIANAPGLHLEVAERQS